VSLPSRLAAHVEPAGPHPWKGSPAPKASLEAATRRSAAQVLVDLEQTARALEGQGSWKVNQGGGLPAAMRGRLSKGRPAVADDPLEPPDRVVFDYSLLCALGVVEVMGADARL